MQHIFTQIAAQNNLELLDVRPLSGGDINAVFLLKTTSEYVVLKTNSAVKFPGMFEAEKQGLALLATSEGFKTPQVKACGAVKDTAYLMLEYISPGTPNKNFGRDFGSKLAILHKRTTLKYGCDHNNYIGSLQQSNNWKTSISEFYISQRLELQFKLARERGFHFGNLDSFYKTISEAIPNEAPALIHGDLWGGNYLVTENGAAVLIDPAVSYASREMDLAMMHLFGGFPSEVYTVYHEEFPLVSDWENRRKLWQLYYLLVHLNLFGAGYLSQVRSVMAMYS